MRIYILEDDPDQSELFTLWLDEYECHVFEKARDLIKQIPFEVPDILLLDWNLPKIKGIDVLHWLKGSRFDDIPVIFMTSRSDEKDIVKALTDGADDYIIKPTSEAILKARIKAVIRRINSKNKRQEINYTFDDYSFNNNLNSVKINNSTVTMTHKEYDLALYFFNNQGLLISRDKLLETIWMKSSDISTRTVDTHISRIRKKLTLDGSNGWKLISVYHQGYKLINQTNE